MSDRLGPPFEVFAASEANSASERCEAYAPKENAAREAQYIARAKGYSNPITTLMASLYSKREEEKAWVYSHFAKIQEDADFVRMMETPKFVPKQSSASHLAQRAHEKVVPRAGDARSVLFAMNT